MAPFEPACNRLINKQTPTYGTAYAQSVSNEGPVFPAFCDHRDGLEVAMKATTFAIKTISAAVMLAGMTMEAGAMPLDLTGASYVTYGDANSYALAVNYAITGNAQWNVDSTPGQIKDLIVVATGANGVPVNTNVAGMDNALSTPNGGIYYFSGQWNSTLSAFAGALGGNNPLFFFNNNQVNSGDSTNQNLAVWAQLSLTGANMQAKYFDFTNQGGKYAPFNLGGGGTLNGNVALYNSSGSAPLAGTNAQTDYVLAGGQICLDAGNAPTPCDGSGNAVVTTVNNNLGADQAAYAIDVPELNQWLNEWLLGQHTGYTDLHIALRYGCDPLTDSALANNCIARDGNNGYEQLFIGTSLADQQVPEPGSLALIGLSLLGLAATRRSITVLSLR